jgi:hypothetical protein
LEKLSWSGVTAMMASHSRTSGKVGSEGLGSGSYRRTTSLLAIGWNFREMELGPDWRQRASCPGGLRL